MSLKGKTLFITGASRGIGLAIALKAARDGANIAVAAKTETPHPEASGTIHSAAEEIEKAGGKALPLVVDVREEETVKKALDQTAAHFGGIDIVVNNASAIHLTPVALTDMRRFDLMHQINARGTFMVSKHAIPHLLKPESAHPDAFAAARYEGEMVRRLHRLRDGQVRHEPRGARPRGRVARQGRRQCAVAADHDRHLGDQEHSRRRRS
jgi:NAD(P)-dependent dehydrogenase (short-subunit alcohol dehydrogenase family)